MGAGRGRSLCALWGGISLGVGTLAYALFSPASVGCSTNVIVLTHSTVTARGCAAYSVVAHLGVGAIVLGAVLLLGSFALAVRNRRSAPTAPSGATVDLTPPAAAEPVAAEPATGTPAPPVDDLPLFDTPTAAPPAAPGPMGPAPVSGTRAERDDVAPAPAPEFIWPAEQPEPAVARTRPIAPGEGVYDDEYVDDYDEVGLLDSAVRLPPGWYGNPNNPDNPVQWWDGTRLTDRPG